MIDDIYKAKAKEDCLKITKIIYESGYNFPEIMALLDTLIEAVLILGISKKAITIENAEKALLESRQLILVDLKRLSKSEGMVK